MKKLILVVMFFVVGALTYRLVEYQHTIAQQEISLKICTEEKEAQQKEFDVIINRHKTTINSLEKQIPPQIKRIHSNKVDSFYNIESK
jgi:hypothetical protein